LAVDLLAFIDELVCSSFLGELPFIRGGETILRTFCLSVLWQIYQTLHLLLRMQECRFTTPSQDAGMIVLSMGDGILTHLP
jgi:hypothetical protein